jgi:pSer/pThr/pTyr-binding forkhead associated (FHA) protein
MLLLVSIAALWRARGRRRPYLEVVEGIDKGKRFNLDQEVNHVGAVPQDGAARNEIVLKDIERMISRFHCEIHNRNGKLFVVDCNSSNGTSVDGTRVAVGKPVRLRNGSRVGLGKTCRLRVGYEKRN